MNRLIAPLFALTLLLSAVACTNIADNDATQADTLPGIVENPDSLEHTVSGIAVDGASRTVYLVSEQDTFDFELPPDIDLHWQIGDSLKVTYITTNEGDSVIYAQQASAAH